MTTKTEMNRQAGTPSDIADQISIVYYTDPLCCWSWAMEPEWQRLGTLAGRRYTMRCCMGGLLPDWHSYHDTENAISRPVQMGPLWMEVHHRTGAPLCDRIWMTDPPASSYPACIAVKAAGLQARQFEAEMLLRLRETVMVAGQNIARMKVLLAAAEQMTSGFNAEQFRYDLTGTAAREAFRKDMEESRISEVTRFPSVQMNSKGKSIRITGFRTAEVLARAMNEF